MYTSFLFNQTKMLSEILSVYFWCIWQWNSESINLSKATLISMPIVPTVIIKSQAWWKIQSFHTSIPQMDPIRGNMYIDSHIHLPTAPQCVNTLWSAKHRSSFGFFSSFAFSSSSLLSSSFLSLFNRFSSFFSFFRRSFSYNRETEKVLFTVPLGNM